MSMMGKNIPHDSARGHVSGESVYIDDMLPARNELFVDFLGSPVSHGIVESLDLSAASQIPGVVGLYTYKDLDGENKFGPIIQDEILIIEDTCEFMGQPLVIIAAENKKALKTAKAAIKYKIKELPPVLTIDDAKDKKQFISVTRRIKRGDAQKAISQAQHTLEGVFYNAGQEHFYLESQAAIAYPGEHDQLVVHSSTQNPTELQHVIAHVLGLQQNQVVCISKRMGGGFGGKECQATHYAAIAALVAHKTKRPARIVLNKDDDMQATGKRHPFQNNFKVAFTDDGLITGLKVDLFADGGAYADLSTAVLGRAMVHTDNAYYIPDIEVTGTICKTNFPPNTAFRGFGGPQGVATIESIIEDIATFLKKDAYEIRRLNCYDIDERNVTPYGQLLKNNTIPEIFERLANSSNYMQRKKEVEAFNAQSKTHLKGLSMTGLKFGIAFNTKFLNQASALINIYLDGTIQVSTGATEMGQGVNTNIQQLVAAEFDISYDKVIVMPTSTEKNNNSSATAASSSTDLNGSAAVNACVTIRERLAGCASKHLSAKQPDLDMSPSNIIFKDGMIYDNRCPELKLSFAELVKLAYFDRVSLGERGFYATPGIDFTWEAGPEKVAFGNPFLYFTTGAAVAEVLIDKFTGEITTERVDILMDVGNPINPGITRGQITGAFIQGLGWVTTEELKYKDNGELLSHSPTTYKIPNIQDTPQIFNVDWIDNTENTVNLKGTKAVGEPPFLLGISVWTAVKHALSFASKNKVITLKLPATGEEVMRVLAEYTSPAKKRAQSNLRGPEKVLIGLLSSANEAAKTVSNSIDREDS